MITKKYIKKGLDSLVSLFTTVLTKSAGYKYWVKIIDRILKSKNIMIFNNVKEEGWAQKHNWHTYQRVLSCQKSMGKCYEMFSVTNQQFLFSGNVRLDNDFYQDDKKLRQVLRCEFMMRSIIIFDIII